MFLINLRGSEDPVNFFRNLLVDPEPSDAFDELRPYRVESDNSCMPAMIYIYRRESGHMASYVQCRVGEGGS